MKIWRNMKDMYTGGYLYGSALSSSFNSKFASFKGLVQASNEVGYPADTYINGGQGMGLVNFDIIQNDGCGAGLWTCEKNHSCTKKEVKGFIVESGPCVVVGKCVTSSNYGKGNYPNNEKCSIKTPSAGTLKVTDYKTERGYDYLTIDGTRYSYAAPPAKILSAPKTISWRSDGSVTNKGFKMCVEDSLLLEEESEDAVESETKDLNENELA